MYHFEGKDYSKKSKEDDGILDVLKELSNLNAPNCRVSRFPNESLYHIRSDETFYPYKQVSNRMMLWYDYCVYIVKTEIVTRRMEETTGRTSGIKMVLRWYWDACNHVSFSCPCPYSCLGIYLEKSTNFMVKKLWIYFVFDSTKWRKL